MSINDLRLAEIERNINYAEEEKRKAQTEITYFMKELERINREITHFNKELTESDRKVSNLRQQEKRVRDEITREAQAKN